MTTTTDTPKTGAAPAFGFGGNKFLKHQLKTGRLLTKGAGTAAAEPEAKDPPGAPVTDVSAEPYTGGDDDYAPVQAASAPAAPARTPARRRLLRMLHLHRLLPGRSDSGLVGPPRCQRMRVLPSLCPRRRPQKRPRLPLPLRPPPPRLDLPALPARQQRQSPPRLRRRRLPRVWRHQLRQQDSRGRLRRSASQAAPRSTSPRSSC